MNVIDNPDNLLVDVNKDIKLNTVPQIKRCSDKIIIFILIMVSDSIYFKWMLIGLEKHVYLKLCHRESFYFACPY